MAEPRKVAFITLSPPECKKRCLEDEPRSPAAPQASGNNAFPGAAVEAAGGEKAAERRITVRLNLRLSEPSEQASAEFNYSELVQSIQVKKPAVALAPVPTNPDDPFDDDERERLQMEAMARKFESKYVSEPKTSQKRKGAWLQHTRTQAVPRPSRSRPRPPPRALARRGRSRGRSQNERFGALWRGGGGVEGGVRMKGSERSGEEGAESRAESE
ncbi:ubinuclein-1-like [Polyodon spathula]|uniref:ubinuclein-1-like n=1 Tax=Polyodon spathula TaxID=7913 RepID=UPI001B7ECD70|nr:ubinuclein-1-like [Polyodon spathula]